MKQKTKINLILFGITSLVAVNIAYFAVMWLSSLDLRFTFQDKVMLGFSIFVIIDTIEIVLMRHGQRRWTHHPGETMVEMVKAAFIALAKDKEAQQALTEIMAFCGEAFMGGMDPETGAAAKGGGGKIVLPEKYKGWEGFVNQPMIKPAIQKQFKEAFGGKGTADKGKETVKFE